ncbi:flagellar hook-basal body complex protein FliE [Campylobacter sp. RM12327]|uniref:flagellar hook-basal body complex protein FliE n=1 Tax=Campylobacter sputorum TaxID=206 RepID=UPI00053BE013|nr:MULTISPECIES: flagellar hook-basal body complex protein FliE [Campylobacter]ASM40298.1 flagellar proximal rod protein [Campylobacter sputorum]MBE7357433.1 flagellar hook-basal body complex protein FliE [Campylobacter sp. RM11302]MBF6668743.1 flagellar hook-basal body complex protein FliE [Campylobacter sp. RM12327]MBF6674711.1 flagellar hook-basal body complex protein FliE [Campylobacter sp. RM13538]MBF6675972.1 flagellar hook-basal body complex protein FliE [Campylobacter sp. RM12321]
MNNINKIDLNTHIGDKNLNKTSSNSGEFSKMLDNSLKELNEVQINADKALADLATGEVKDLHQAALAISKAETSMKLMLEIRNKALSAYKEISRTQL